MRHPIFGPILHVFGNLADFCGMTILAVTGIQASVPAVEPAPQAPSALPSIFTSGGLITWIVVGGGSVWAIRQLGELIYTVIFKLRSGWLTAAAGTDHQRADDCERQRAADQEAIVRLRNEVTGAYAIAREKDEQIARLNEQVDRKDEQISKKDDKILAQHDELLRLSINVSSNNTKLIEASVVPRTSNDAIPVVIAPSSAPVPVHEVGEHI